MPGADKIVQQTGTGPGTSPILFSARPEPLSFLYRYLLSFTSVILVMLCIVVRGFLDSLFLAASPGVISLFPVPATPASNASSAAMAQYTGMLNAGVPGFNDFTAVTILLVAPVGIFLLAAAAGNELRQTQAWTGSALTLLLSLCASLILAGSFSASLLYFTLFLQWTAFLVQPFSIIASVLVLLGTEKFRRSIRYEITPNAVVISGGIFRRVEQIIPLHRVSRVTLDQDLIGSRFNFGTVVPGSSVHGDIPFRGTGAHGEKDHAGTGAGYGGGTGASRDPLDCLFGIPDPGSARQVIERMMEKPGPEG